MASYENQDAKSEWVQGCPLYYRLKTVNMSEIEQHALTDFSRNELKNFIHKNDTELKNVPCAICYDTGRQIETSQLSDLTFDLGEKYIPAYLYEMAFCVGCGLQAHLACVMDSHPSMIDLTFFQV